MYRELKSCIVCNSTDLVEVFDMGSQYVVDFVKEKDESMLKCPLVLNLCRKCSLVQLKHRVNPDRMYKKMWYRSGINGQMKNELLAIVQKAQRAVELKKGDLVLDIGCNDGTMLGWYDQGILTCGIDPCEHLVLEGMHKAKDGSPKKIDIGIIDYFSAGAVRSAFKSMGAPPPQFKVITAIAMFYDVETPVEFLKDCKELLHGEGVLIVQMNYLKSMIESGGFDNISHEHLGYYTVQTLGHAVAKAGLDLAGIEFSKSNGGSMRAYITHQGFTGFVPNDYEDRLWLSANVGIKIIEEMRSGLNLESTYQTFAANIQAKMEVLKKYLVDISNKEPLYAYGASTRGTALIQYLFRNGGNEIVQGVAERDETKYGLKMVGTWWPILSEAEVRSKCQSMFVLPWHFKDSIVDREKSWLMGGGKLVFPLPSPVIIAADQLVSSETKVGA